MPTDKAQAEAVGHAIYQEKIRDTLEPDDQGKLVVIDIASGDHEIDADHIAALLRLRQRRPNARTWTEGWATRQPITWAAHSHPNCRDTWIPSRA